MMNNITVSIYTQVYNTKQLLPRCIESVLHQTFHDFEYILIDNASTDGSRELMQEYAKHDSRIKIIYIEKNTPSIWIQVAKETAKGQYISELDSDDWLEADFLERMVFLAQKHQLDIVCTGSAFHIEGKENADAGSRSFPQQLIMERSAYALYLPYYHVFFRTIWGKLIRREVFTVAEAPVIDREKIKNGSDTIWAFAWIRQANRICVDNSVLHHYLVRQKSFSHIYLPNRFKSNTILHQDALDFLSQYGPVSQENLHFLHIVYANAVFDTLEVLWTSDLSSAEKLNEYCTIALHPTTGEAYQDADPAIDRSKGALIQQLLSTAAQCGQETGGFSNAMQKLLPRCGCMVTAQSVPLFLRERNLLPALLQDDVGALTAQLLDLIAAKRYTKQYDLGKLVCALAADKPLLCKLDDTNFLRKYRDIYWKIWQGNMLEALDDMTGMLLEDRIRGSEETFLQLYLSAAAYLEQVPAFLFGKTRLAGLYQRRNQLEQYQTIAEELKEMGVEEW